ncbi:DNA mismatch repair protein MutS [Acidiphilium sp. JA12-A1]|uniref:DNA mismatch repair protein MutS n=1 Tax=Acidiphilium sp. JA12-A1 TaxID=1464546 RepID=UPI00046105ED|nr:DNA mismatch repair protein MutS [Acidiphilium sp. JA12-A1]KDM67661.1 DNA mismatch repair protein MutS [Acidiphilium sp. JA12-A1]
MNSDRAAGATPAMAQWFQAKADYPDALIFFRMGDFYELFFEDAEAASAALDIALTARGTHQGEPIAMCGVPVSQRDTYLTRLIRRGFRVAVAEQVEAPEAAKARGGKALIERAVVRLITPGTITEEALLDQGRASLLLALVPRAGRIGAAWLDVSTASFETADLAGGELAALLGRLDPAEILSGADIELGAHEGRRTDPGPAPAAELARRDLARLFDVASLDAFGAFTDQEAQAAAVALRYVERSQAGTLPRIARPVRAGETGLMAMDAATRASLDLLRTADGGEAGSLFGAVRRTVTAAGARMLAGWIAAPLDAIGPLRARQAGWQSLLDAPGTLAALRTSLRGAPDLARALARLGLAGRKAGRLSPRDLGQVRDSLAAARAVAEGLAPAVAADPAHPLADDLAKLAAGPELGPLLEAALVETPPARIGDAPAIRAGFDGELDGERRLRDDTRQVIAALQTELASRYGVASLKVRHHSQLGYVLEAPAAAVEALRAFPELILRQGLASAARFTHPELSDLDRRIAEAHERAAAREALVLDHLLAAVMREEAALAECAAALARLDALQSAATLAESGRWCAPELSEDAAFSIIAGRHPVVEAALPAGTRFIANDADLSPERRLMLLTGPNMAGKSTFLRQNALVIILAQAGLPVPAEQARIGLVDRLFSRVGAADDLAAGRSTFMVEMIETASILNQAGPRSFVIIDEIGRGTGTRDGLAIAQAVLEALHGSIRCRSIFATHFHDLVQLGAALPRLRPCTMRVKSWRGSVVFLHEVIEGAAERSWGVHVAKLAGLPEPVIRRADALLRAAERGGGEAGALPLFAAAGEDPAPPAELPAADGWHAALAEADPDQLSPRAALELIYAWRRKFLGDRANGAVEKQ